jgi:hypothetical protein
MIPVPRTDVPSEIQSAHLWDRIGWARENLRRVEPTYAVVFEDPAEPDAAAKVLHPAPEWLAMALNGHLLPPVDTYLRDALRKDGEPKEHPYAAPIGPMTEEQAIEYLIQKDIPARVWAEPTNRPRFAIVRRAAIPTDRTHRNAWRLNDFARAA